MPINRRRVLAAGGLGALATIAKPFGIAPSGASAAAATALAAASTSWTGTRKIAFFLTSTRIDPVRPDWAEEIDRRINFDISSGQDLSLQAFFRANSYGRARIEGHVRGMEVFPPGDIPVNALASKYEASLRAEGFDGGFLVCVGEPGAGSAQPAGFWSRAAFSEHVGVWAMELLHAMTGYKDLYVFPNHLDVFDNMASSRGVHCSTFTKRVLGWVDDPWIVRHTGRLRTYDLHALALNHPAPPGRTTAVQFGAAPKHFIVEARLGTDQFDGRIPAERQGVIVYQVENPDTEPSSNLVLPNLPLHTRNGLRPGQAFLSATRIEVRVIAEISGGYTVRIIDPDQHLINRSAEYATPPAAGRPAAVVTPGPGVHNLIYRDTSGRLWELYRDSADRTGRTDLTSNAGAPTAIGDPFAYAHQPTNTTIALYRSAGGVVHSLYWTTGAVGHDNLSGTAGAPTAAGDPVGYHMTFDDTHHVIYRTSNGHLHELWSSGFNRVQYGGDITASVGSAPNAVGNPSAYAARGTNFVFYRGTDNRIHSLYWDSGAVGHDNLSAVAGMPNAGSEPFAYYHASSDVHQIVYVGVDGHIYELYAQGASSVVGWDLSAQSGAPAAVGNLTAYYDATANIKHVIFRSAGGRLHDIWWRPGGGTPAHTDLTALAAAPLATSTPVGFATTNPNTQHVAYCATGNPIYEIAW